MSLKQYSPHLQLTIHRSKQLFLGLRLLSCCIVALLVLSVGNILVLFGGCVAVAVLHILTERRLLVAEHHFIINEYVLSRAGDEFELQALRILFGYFVVITLRQGSSPILLCRDQLSRQDWQDLIRFNKLQA